MKEYLELFPNGFDESVVEKEQTRELAMGWL